MIPLTMVTWESDMKEMPPWDADTETISSVSVTGTTPETWRGRFAGFVSG